MTIMPAASITSTSPFDRSGPTATILSPSISTSPLGRSPSRGSMLSTIPPRISVLPDGATRKSGPLG
jgi:hypothetical protein